MRERHQTKARLLAEVAALRQQVAELQAAASVQGVVVNSCALTEQRLPMEEALRESEERLRLVMRLAPVLLYDLDVKSGTFSGSDGTRQLFKLEPPPGFGSDWWQTQIHPEDRPAMLASLQAALASGEEFWTGEYRSARGDGSYAYVVNRARFVRNADGDLVRLVGAATDISQRKQTELALQESEIRYRTLFENANDTFAVVNLDRTVANINRAMEKLLGWSREELIGQDYYRVLTPAGIALSEERERRLQAGEKIPSIFEHDFLCKDGRTVPVEGRIRFIRDQAGTPIGFQGIYRDISERKLAAQKLQVERNFATQIMTTMGQGLVVVGADYTIEYINPAVARMLGYQPEDVIGKSATSFIVPEDESRLLQVRERLWRGETLTYEMYVRRADGQYLPALITAAPRLNEGKITGTIQTISDLTERKQAEAERQQLQAHLFQVQKLEAVGTLAGGIAHDFNNILTVMLGCTELAMDEVPVATEAHENLEEVLRAGRRAKALVQQILTFSRSDQEERQRLCLQTIVKEALTFLSAVLPKTMRLHYDLTCPTETILANSTQIQQVIINLCINAIQAMEEKGGILQVGLRRIVAADCIRHSIDSLPPGPCLALTVHDTGCGMSPEILERMYEPFFTTKAVGKGTGLGLAMVHGIVKNHGGAITVDSQPGQGTTFYVYLPLIAAALTPGSEEPGQPPIGMVTTRNC